MTVASNYDLDLVILAQTETDEETVKDEMAQQYKALQSGGGAPSTGEQKKKQKGIKRFFGK